MKNSSFVKDAIVLFVITLVAGWLLGAVYEVTKAPIATAEFDKKQEAYKKVFPEANGFAGDADLDKLAKEKAGTNFVEEVEIAMDKDNNEIGYAMTIGSKEGYGGEIKLSLGVDKTGTITGMEVLSMSETAGLGANCTTEEFKSQFSGIKAEQIAYTKSGKSKDNEIDALGGATITTNAVTNAVNNALSFIHENGKMEQ